MTKQTAKDAEPTVAATNATAPSAPATERVRIRIGAREHRHAGITLAPGTELVLDRDVADSIVRMENGAILGAAS